MNTIKNTKDRIRSLRRHTYRDLHQMRKEGLEWAIAYDLGYISALNQISHIINQEIKKRYVQ